jgi:hypothetical protein
MCFLLCIICLPARNVLLISVSNIMWCLVLTHTLNIRNSCSLSRMSRVWRTACVGWNTEFCTPTRNKVGASEPRYWSFQFNPLQVYTPHITYTRVDFNTERNKKFWEEITYFPFTTSWVFYVKSSRSQWPHDLRHEMSSPAQTLGSWVRIALKDMDVCPSLGSGLATGCSRNLTNCL